jgi:hypothetical protein
VPIPVELTARAHSDIAIACTLQRRARVALIKAVKRVRLQVTSGERDAD